MKIQKHPDKEKARSIIRASEEEIKFTLSITPTNQSASTIIRNLYESFRMLGEAILIKEGISTVDHREQIQPLLNLNIQTERPLQLIDQLRKSRHSINYYGYRPSKTDAEDAIDFTKKCFHKIFLEVNRIIEQ